MPRNRFAKGRFSMSLPQDDRFTETRIPVEARPPRNFFRNKGKRLTNKASGRRIEVKGGVGWKEICDEILRDGTNPKSLAAVAAGKWKTANGWEVEILD